MSWRYADWKFGKGELELEEAGSYLMLQWLETTMTSMLWYHKNKPVLKEWEQKRETDESQI